MSYPRGCYAYLSRSLYLNSANTAMACSSGSPCFCYASPPTYSCTRTTPAPTPAPTPHASPHHALTLCQNTVGLLRSYKGSGDGLQLTQVSGVNDPSARNLSACTGECDGDAQCAAGLRCLERSNGEHIPGCDVSTAPTGDWDYCYNASNAAASNLTSCWTRYPLSHCNGNTHGIAYSTLSAAAGGCIANGSDCWGVYDGGCDNTGTFYTCKPGSFYVSSPSVAKQTSDKCAHPITSASACAQAATSLGLSDTTVSVDGQSDVSYDPRGCYYEGGSLKYNSANTNTGDCTESDECLCEVSSASCVYN